MSSKDEKWYDSDDPEKVVRGAAWFGGKWIALIVVICIVAGIAGWAINTALSGPAGQAGAYRQKQSTQNRLFAQANFEDRYNTIQKDVANIAVARAAVKADGAVPTQYDKTNLTGAIQVCNQDVADYNADSGKYLLRDFKSAGLPKHVELSMCK